MALTKARLSSLNPTSRRWSDCHSLNPAVEVFKDITGITVDNFRCLRNGGDFVDERILKRYRGQAIDEMVFNDSDATFADLYMKTYILPRC